MDALEHCDLSAIVVLCWDGDCRIASTNEILVCRPHCAATRDKIYCVTVLESLRRREREVIAQPRGKTHCDAAREENTASLRELPLDGIGPESAASPLVFMIDDELERIGRSFKMAR